MLAPKEFVEPSLWISPKSVCLNPQSLRDSPLLRGVTLLIPPSPGGLSQDYILLLKRLFNEIQ